MSYVAWALTVRPRGGIEVNDYIKTISDKIQKKYPPGWMYTIEERGSDAAHIHALVFDQPRKNKEGKAYTNLGRDIKELFNNKRGRKNDDFGPNAVYVSAAYKPLEDDDTDHGPGFDGKNRNWILYMEKEKDNKATVVGELPEDWEECLQDNIPKEERGNYKKDAWEQMERFRKLFEEYELDHEDWQQVDRGVSKLANWHRVVRPPEPHKYKGFILQLTQYLNRDERGFLEYSEDVAMVEFERKQAKRRKIADYQEGLRNAGMDLMLTQR